jgi:hypothetical protein
MATVIDGTKDAVRFQSRLPSSSVHILLDRGIGVPALIVAQIFWQPTMASGRFNKIAAGASFFGPQAVRNMFLAFLHQPIIRSLDDRFTAPLSPN